MMRSRVTLPASRTARGPAKRETLHSSVDSVGSTRMSQHSGSADSGPVRNAVRPPGWERRPQLCRRTLWEPGKAASAPWAFARVGWGSLVGAVWVCARCPRLGRCRTHSRCARAGVQSRTRSPPMLPAQARKPSEPRAWSPGAGVAVGGNQPVPPVDVFYCLAHRELGTIELVAKL